MAVNTEILTPVGLLLSPLKVGIEIASKFGKNPYKEFGQIDYNDEIETIRVRNIWRSHGFISAIGSIFTAPLAGSSLTHWWVEIETKKGWYCAQWESTTFVYSDNYHYIGLSKHDSSKDVTERAKWKVGCKGEEKNITNKETHYYYKKKKKTIHDLVKVMQRQGPYNLVSNNSQHFGLRVYNWIIK